MEHKGAPARLAALGLALLLTSCAGARAAAQLAQVGPADEQARPLSPPAADARAAEVATAPPSLSSQPPPSAGQQTQAPAAATTPSPFKLPTVMPELDSNKELLDYDQTLLNELKFYPTPSELQQALSASAASGANSTSAATGDETFERWLINRYHDQDQLHAYLAQLVQAHPQVARLHEIGQSVEGRKLWALEIGEPPGAHRALRPDFRYVANMHGNEAVGRELLLHLARLLLDNYRREEPAADANKPTGVKFIKKLVRATRIFLMPSMNPDGFARSDVGCKFEVPSQRGRVNANNVDLNRNFPDPLLGTREPDAGTQPEVRALMDWSRREPFVLSANLHGGALVAGVPYDGLPQASAIANASSDLPAAQERRSPDHAVYVELARAYTRAHPTMWRGEMCYDKCTDYHPEVFPNEGITTGAGWYALYGAMQDWCYENTNDFHVTLELGCNQYPPPEALHQYWQFNKAPLLNYMRQAHRGIKGVVEDELTGARLAQVRVHVRSISHNVTSTHAGDYFRLLAPGNYRVLFERADYQPAEMFVSVRRGMAQVHNIKMRPRSDTTPAQAAGGSEGTGPALDGEPAPLAGPADESQRSIALATLVMTVVIILLLVLLAGAYLVQKGRFARSQSVSVELQPSGRSAASTGISLPPLPGGSSLKTPGGGGGRGSLSPHASS